MAAMLGNPTAISYEIVRALLAAASRNAARGPMTLSTGIWQQTALHDGVIAGTAVASQFTPTIRDDFAVGSAASNWPFVASAAQ